MIFTLSRNYVRERVELAADRFAFAIYLHWGRVVDSEIEAADLMRELLTEDAFLPNLNEVLHYLEGCKNAGQTPMSRQITTRICPWTVTEDDEFY